MSQFMMSICATIGLSALGASAFVATHPAPIAPAAMTPSEELSLQRMNDTACQCQKRLGEAGKATCWVSFDHAMRQRFDAPTATAAACFPVPGVQFCWDDENDEGCKILSDYVYMVRGKQTFCSPAATKAAEKLWSHALPAGWPAGTAIGRAACASD